MTDEYRFQYHLNSIPVLDPSLHETHAYKLERSSKRIERESLTVIGVV